MKRFAAFVIACGLGIAATHHARAQNPPRDTGAAPAPAGTAVIAGVIVDNSAQPAPVRRVRVTLTNVERNVSQSTASDDRGHFEFRSIPAGRYSLQATKAAWLPASFGAKRPGRPGTPIVIADGQRPTALTLTMWHGAAVSGRVRFQDGTAATGVNVDALRSTTRNGEVTLVPAGSGAVVTDDRGEYRIFGLPPGDVLVFATVQGQGRFNSGELRQIESGEVDRTLQQIRQRGGAAVSVPGVAAAPAITTVDYAAVFYPGTADPSSATATTLAAGDEVTGIDLVLPLIRTARITGTVSIADGSPLPLTTLLLNSTGPVFASGIGINGIARATTDKEGKYRFDGVAPGQYSLGAATSINQTNGAAELTAEESITIGGQDLDVPVTLRPSGSITGRVVFDGGAPPSERGLRVAVQGFGPLAKLIARAYASDVTNGEFSYLRQVVPGKYRLTVTGLPADRWFIKSSTARGQETLDASLEIPPGVDVTDWVITYTDHPSELAGTLQDTTGRAAPDYFIIVFPTDRSKWTPSSWRIKQTRPSVDGSFSIKGLPTGDYFVAALTDVEPGEWFSPAFLEQIVGLAKKVMLTEGQKTMLPLRLSGGTTHP